MATRSATRTGVAAAVLAFASAASALEGEFTPETRAKLDTRVTIQAEAVPLAGLVRHIAEQTGLSFAASAHVARMPDPVAVFARDVPAVELLDAVAFSMDLDVRVTPGGVVAVRLDPEDPRREAMIERMFPPQEGRPGGPPPRVDEREVVDRAADHPKVRGILDKLGGRLVPAEFVHDKRLWVLAIRREGEEEPLGHVVATEEGEVVDVKLRGKDRPFDKERPDKRPDPEWGEKPRREAEEDGKRFRKGEDGEKRFREGEERPEQREKF